MSKFLFFGVFFSMNFFIPKLMNIRWSSLFWGSFTPHFQIKLNIHASNFNSRFVSMSELELFLFKGVLTPNFNSKDLLKILEKHQELHIQIVVVTLKVTSGRTMRKKKKVKKSEKPWFYGQIKLFFENPALQPLGSSSHMPACRSSLESTWKMSLILIFNKNSPWAHAASELGGLGVYRELVKYVIHSSKKKNWNKIKFLHTYCLNSNRTVSSLREF
jgi:hypothetical protein